MQLKVECVAVSSIQPRCVLCHQIFESREARVIVCNYENTECGDVCPDCIRMGFHWMQHQFLSLKVLDGDRGGLRKSA